MLELLQKPVQNIGSSSTPCGINNIHQFVRFIFKRRDFEISSITDNIGSAQLNTSVAFGSEIVIGTLVSIYVNNVYYSKNVEVISIDSTTSFTVDLNFVGNATGFLNTSERKNWYAEMQVFSTTPSLLTDTLAGTLQVTDIASRVNFTVDNLLKSKVIHNDRNIYINFEYNDWFEFNAFRVVYYEVYNNVAQEPMTIADPMHYINSINQIRYRSDANMEYYAYGDSSNLLKYLTAFIRPTVFVGYPFCFNFLPIIGGKRVTVKQRETYPNGTIIDTNISTLTYLKRTKLAGINNGQKTADVKIITGDLTPTDVSETITVDIDSDCHDNGIYLNWLDTTGGRAFWLFDRVQTITVETDTSDTFEQFVQNLSSQQADVLEIENFARNKIVLTAYVPIAKIQGIKSMLYSLNVLMLINPDTWQSNGTIWEAVRPVKGSFALYNTNQTYTSLQVTIERVATNIQSR